MSQFTAWARANPDKAKAARDAWRLANPGKILEDRRVYKAANREKIRRYNFKRRYGISLERLAEMIAERDSRCDICGFPSPRLNVDHCHRTRLIRGLLCQHCNTSLWIIESPLHAKALEYLRVAAEGEK